MAPRVRRGTGSRRKILFANAYFLLQGTEYRHVPVPCRQPRHAATAAANGSTGLVFARARPLRSPAKASNACGPRVQYIIFFFLQKFELVCELCGVSGCARSFLLQRPRTETTR